MKLYGVSDLHLNVSANRLLLESLPFCPGDWLVLGGDVGETEEHLRMALSIVAPRFQRVLWVPGNHDLWTLPSDKTQLRGEAKYRRLVAICRSFGVLTPEDPFIRWPGEGLSCLIAPLFVLYDYSFRPSHISKEHAVEWAIETDIMCADEVLLHPDPYPSPAEWCAARCAYTEHRLEEVASRGPLILVNHFPLRRDLVHLPRIPRFEIWCGTLLTESWHKRFNAAVVVYGHLHVRGTQMRDGVRFEEVSLGTNPWAWHLKCRAPSAITEILPGPIL